MYCGGGGGGGGGAKISEFSFSVLHSTAANSEVIGGSLTCSGAFASDSSGRLPIDCTELLLEAILLVLLGVPV
jgi:hypothetical protein